MGGKSTTVERVLARIGSRDHGVVARRELLAAGVSAREIERRVEKGVLIPEFRGVYRVGHRAPSIEARYTAAVKACGEGAVLSGLAAAFLWALVKRPPSLPVVTVPGKRRVEGVSTRRATSVQRTAYERIPITTPAQTLVDIAPRLTDPELARACHEAQVRYRLRPEHVERILDRHPNAAGAGRLRRALRGDTDLTLSALEREFLRILRAAGLSLPRTNRKAGGRYIDCRWPERRLTVELDSYRFHNTRHAFEQDRKREREAYARGDQLRRYTWGDVFETPQATIEELRPLLQAA